MCRTERMLDQIAPSGQRWIARCALRVGGLLLIHLLAVWPECAGQPPPPADQPPQPEWRTRPPEDPLPAGALRRIGTARFWPYYRYGVPSGSGSRFANSVN